MRGALRGGQHVDLANGEGPDIDELVLVVGQRGRGGRADGETEQFRHGFADLRDRGRDDGVRAVVVEGGFAVGDVDAEPAAFEALRAM